MATKIFASGRPVVLWLLALMAMAWPIKVAEADERRVALVIGNSSYEAPDAWAPLPNAARDARHIEQTLGRPRADGSQFEVTLLIDADRTQMIEALKRFAAEAAEADIALVYYSGHGVEFNLDNYLVPVDAPPIVSQRRLPNVYVNMADVVDAAVARQMSIFFLDACRDNGGVIRINDETEGNRAALFGAINAPESLVLYATAMGDSAYDAAPEDAPLSPFASAVAKNVTRPGVDIPYVFTAIVKEVKDATSIFQPQPVQKPQIAGSWSQQFFFTPAAPTTQRRARSPRSGPLGPQRALEPLSIPMSVLDTTDEPLLVLELLERYSVDDLAQLADGGDALATYILGYMNVYGVGVPKDHDKARMLLERAAKTDHPAGLLEYAHFLDNFGTDGEEQQALSLYRAAAAKGFAKAQTHLATILATGRLGVRDPDEARRLYRTAADKGYPYAIYTLALIEPDSAARVDALQKIAANGNADGNHWLCRLESRRVTVANQFDHCLIAAKAGYENARALTAIRYADGDGVAPDPSKARYWARLALGSPHLLSSHKARLSEIAGQ